MAGTKRERELARLRAERQAARRAAQRARQRRRNAIIASVLSVLAVIGAVGYLTTRDNGGDTLATPAASPTPQATTPGPAEPGAPGTCSYSPAADAAGGKKVELPAPGGFDRTKPRTATLTTSAGKVTFETLTAKAPCTVNSFTSLAGQNYFDNTPCHRLTTDGIFVLQCGDPTGQGNGGPGYQFADENLEGATYPRGTVAMANAGPGTNGSQFFLVYKDSQLGPDFTPWGRITGGLEVLDAIAKAGTDNGKSDGKPKTPVTITDFTIV